MTDTWYEFQASPWTEYKELDGVL